jgi:TonB family protein
METTTLGTETTERYVPLARAPLANAAELETSEDVVEVRVAWGDDVLVIKHVRAGERFVIGEGDDVDWLVPASLLGATRHVLVEDGRVVLPPSAVTTGAGDDVARFHLGDFEVRAIRTHAGKAAERGRELDRRPVAYVGATLALAGLMIVGFSLVPPKSAALSIDHLDARSRLVAIYLSPPETEIEEPIPEMGPTGPAGGEGQRHDGDEGAMGDPSETRSNRQYAVRGPQDNQNPTLARDRSPEAVQQVGALGALRSIAGTWNAPTSPYGAATAIGQDPMDALGALMGVEIGSSHGALGLGLHGTGRGAGGDGRDTIGLDSLGDTLGHGGGATCDPGVTCRGYGRVGGLGMGRAAQTPRELRVGPVETNGGLSKEVIRRVVRRHHNEVKFCYEQALRARPDLEGRVTTRFMISPSGSVAASVVQSSTLGSGEAEQCITQAITRWNFPAPSDGGMVSVTYPFVFSSAD